MSSDAIAFANMKPRTNSNAISCKEEFVIDASNGLLFDMRKG